DPADTPDRRGVSTVHAFVRGSRQISENDPIGVRGDVGDGRSRKSDSMVRRSSSRAVAIVKENRPAANARVGRIPLPLSSIRMKDNLFSEARSPIRLFAGPVVVVPADALRGCELARRHVMLRHRTVPERVFGTKLIVARPSDGAPVVLEPDAVLVWRGLD